MGEVKKKLTDKQERFCQEYMIDLNASRAAIKAGYSKKGINKRVTRMMANDGIKERLKILKEEEKGERGNRKQRYLEELEKLALSDITKYGIDYVDTEYLEENRIKAKVKVTTEEEVDPLICSTAAIQEISQGKYGIKIKTHDKITPLLKLIEREDKLEAIEKEKKDSENKPGSNLSEVLKQSVSEDWARWKEENENSDTTV